jgi:hypothetical protein
MAATRSQIYADMWDTNAKATIKAAEAIAEGKRFKTAQAGKSHPLWLLGHLANTNNLLVHIWCCEKDSLLPKGFGKKFAPDFAGGDPIVIDPSNYPSWDEILGHYKTVSEACGAGIRGLSDAELDGELRGGAPDQMKQMFNPIEDCIRKMLMHEAHHRGQMAMLGALS